jgi:SSS family solute:Na+ symporter
LYFLKTDNLIASQMTNDLDKIIPLFINRAMPEWFGAVFMLCILSASMSTLSSHFHTMGGAFGADMFPKLGRKNNPTSSLGVRFGVMCSILFSYVICYVLSANIIARGTALFMGVCAVTFLPAYFCSLYWKKVTKQGALASMWVGLLSSLFIMAFLHKAEAAPIGLCKVLFGKDVLIETYPWFAVDQIVFSLPLSIITIVVVSLLTRKQK